MNIVSGEKLQALAQISFCTETSIIINEQLKRAVQNLHRIKDFDVKEIKKYKIIFCYTHDIDNFLTKFFDYLENNTILITHNSDNFIDSKYENYLNNDKIKKWYCQNRYFSHPKLVSIPIGLANSQWQHGDQELITKIKNENNKKEFLVYKNFDINTNFDKRKLCEHITNSNGIPMSIKTDNEQYWRMISKSVFTISPHGNGVDSHRIWECLYLGTIPIVEDHECFSQFKHLPILFVKDWNEITVPFLKNIVNKFNFEQSIKEVDINFWRDVIVDI